MALCGKEEDTATAAVAVGDDADDDYEDDCGDDDTKDNPHHFNEMLALHIPYTITFIACRRRLRDGREGEEAENMMSRNTKNLKQVGRLFLSTSSRGSDP